MTYAIKMLTKKYKKSIEKCHENVYYVKSTVKNLVKMQRLGEKLYVKQNFPERNRSDERGYR